MKSLKLCIFKCALRIVEEIPVIIALDFIDILQAFMTKNIEIKSMLVLPRIGTESLSP